MSGPMLAWTEPSPPNGETSFYDHCTAETPFGQFRIEWKSWKDYPSYTLEFRGDFLSDHSSLHDAKEAAAAWLIDGLAALFLKPAGIKDSTA